MTWLKGSRKKQAESSIRRRSHRVKARGLPWTERRANWPPASYNPQTKLFYTRVRFLHHIHIIRRSPRQHGTRCGVEAQPPTAQAALQELLKGYTTGQFLRAMDPFTGKKVWDYPTPRAGVLSTAGGLVFTSGVGGLLALDAKTGKPIWNLNIVNAGQTAPMTYMVGGKQYIALQGSGAVIAYMLF